MVNERLLMADTMTFGKLLDAANESKTGRGPGQWTPAACKAWREADPEMARMLTRLRGFAYGKVDFPMGAWCQGFDFP